ncbi:hypothetical protein HUG17_1738 [Dermatophagoides farinae]|uniref:Uncharacterized protein n=1 Tax=Dermatophagoides farinae TaxID=6954 RepID=A0A9D4P7E5_DERFA|nr:hypothetical protein HUG17_1738 [Dermatophagoides farinae]
MPRINWKNSPFAELEKKLNQRSNILRRNVGKLTAEEIDKYFPKGICGFEGCETKLSNLSCLKRHIEMKHTALYQQLTSDEIAGPSSQDVAGPSSQDIAGPSCQDN